YGRGNFNIDALGAKGIKASMGPRPYGRGNAGQRDVGVDGHIASMGPRPYGRGNGQRSVDDQHDRWLQWGRDRTVAEMYREATREGIDYNASMGPRPYGRGNGSLAR